MTRANDKGEAAYFRGETYSDNPYPKGTLRHFDWAMSMGSGATEENLLARDKLIAQIKRDML